MNGGTFTVGKEKERAGIYFNFKTTAEDRVSVGERGTVALPIASSWGEVKKFISISSIEDLNKKVGLNIDDPSLLLLREAMKKASTVLLYRLTEGLRAQADISEGVKATALYGGTKGNDIIIRITENVIDSSKVDVTTYLDQSEVDKQTVSKAEELKANKLVEFTGQGDLTVSIPLTGTAPEDVSGDLPASSGIRLSGGTDKTPTNADYTAFLEAAETEYFDTIALPVEDNEQLKATFVAFIKRLRDNQGLKVQGVLSNYKGDHEGIINVTGGVLLEDGTEITPEKATAWVAGASAGATFNQSLTFVEYAGAVDVLTRLDNDQVIQRLANGEFLFTYDSRDKSVSVEKDINSLTSLTAEKNKMFQKNKIVRVLDAINNDLTSQLKALIKSRKASGSDVPATNDGLQFVKTLITQYLSVLQDNGGITNFDSENDITIALNSDRDGFLIDLAVQPVDAAEKFYFNVEVK
ncbi:MULTISPECIES: phage tail sheath family protein [Bacillus]|uniref:phage tail sheath family protein n=1 Tax=Bacillus TaxID=1386 RepID=UPI0021F79A58|nr:MULTISPECIES: phage tail sheath family protein [Bacillus subtilis group]MCY7784782.1 phage tail sheath family protein [Bacillus sp. S20C3]MCY8290289.1 phage tail sheath family protein [Bacillus sp. N13C7]MCY8637678.1 phage tail sheath family protein [Bacillus sp. S17B2]MCY9144763.1 phage tail sheath family protein [Bacillus sp. T9C1]MCW0121633.1 phage tail sheath family protein [Bacillus subtilis]